MSVLGQPALVLNKSWVAITTTTVRRAVALMFVDSARAVVPQTYETHGFDSWADLEVDDDEPFIQAVSMKIRVPEVIQLTAFNGMPRTTVAFSRRNLFRRDNNECQYCGARPGTSELTIDHIIPRSKGGPSTWLNCVLACARCNRQKGDRTPQKAGMRLRRQPGPPAWAPHLDVAHSNRREVWNRFIKSRKATAGA